VFCNSGTSALQIALAALKEVYGYQDGDEVLVPATTFIATSNVVIQNGLKPVFVDVDPVTFNMDPQEMLAAITPRTRCVIPVHLFGLPANIAVISSLALWAGLQVIEDSCETMFASQYGQPVGSFGD
jgi:dTDP-4-amino-4,6-dideoxygalactose transaminase